MKLSILLARFLLLTPVAFAQLETFTVNPARSELKMTRSTNHEVVHVQSGSVQF